jgi:hypothetical protein
MSPKLEPRARIDEERLRQGGAELIAPVASVAAHIRDAVDKELVSQNLGMVVSCEHASAAGVVRMRMRQDDRADRCGGEPGELGLHRLGIFHVAGCVDHDRPALAFDQH